MSAVALTKQGIAAHNAGDKAQASALFIRAIQADPGYEMAWLWLSSCLSDEAERRYCLEQALKVNPQSTAARRGLAQLGHGPSQAPTGLVEATTEEVAPPPELAPRTKPPIKKKRPGVQYLLVILAVICACLVLLVVPTWWETGMLTFTPPDPIEYSAYSVCKEFVTRRLKTPSNAVFAAFDDATRTNVLKLDGGKYRVKSSVDAQNSFGATIRLNYSCYVHPVAGNQWQLDDLLTDES